MEQGENKSILGTLRGIITSLLPTGKPISGNKVVDDREFKKNLPTSRISKPNFYNNGVGGIATVSGLKKSMSLVTTEYSREYIDVIRKLSYVNQNISQAINNIVELGNTGHNISFDASVDEPSINKMKTYLDKRKLEWSDSEAGMDGLVNKMISQIMISGALSNEWVPNNSLTGVDRVVLVNPESIEFAYDSSIGRYLPYQRTTQAFNGNKTLIKLNTNTYKYYALNGSTEIPYAIPPYLAALEHVAIQKTMLDNIKFLIEQLGLAGFMEVLIAKPQKEGGENEEAYYARLNATLTEAKTLVESGMRDGISVGYLEETEFNFHSTAKEFIGAKEIFELNENLFMSAIKQDGSMLGKSFNTSETQINIVFTKMLSQIKNIQRLIKRNLEFGYSLDLRLAGFKFNTLTVEFNESSAVDKLKDEQAKEIKIRNQNGLYADGIIGQDQYARHMGYEKPSKVKPRFLRNNVQTEAEAKAKREKGKDSSAVKGREKSKRGIKTKGKK